MPVILISLFDKIKAFFKRLFGIKEEKPVNDNNETPNGTPGGKEKLNKTESGTKEKIS